MDALFRHNKLNTTSKLKRTPRASKKVNVNKFLSGIEYAQKDRMSYKLSKRNNKLSVSDQDFIAGIDSALCGKLDIKG